MSEFPLTPLHADLSQRAMVDTTALPWVSSPEPTVERKLIERAGGDGTRATSLVKFAARCAISGPHTPRRGRISGSRRHVLRRTGLLWQRQLCAQSTRFEPRPLLARRLYDFREAAPFAERVASAHRGRQSDGPLASRLGGWPGRITAFRYRRGTHGLGAMATRHSFQTASSLWRRGNFRARRRVL